MKSAQELLASLPKPKKRQGGKKSRKHGRNYRWGQGPDGRTLTHTTTKYRARHGKCT